MAENGQNDQKKRTSHPAAASMSELSLWRREGTFVHLQLIDGSKLIGSLNCFDNWNVNIKTKDMGDITVLKHTLLWYSKV